MGVDNVQEAPGNARTIREISLNGQVTTASLLRTRALLSFDDWDDSWANGSAQWVRRRGNLYDGLADVRHQM